MSEIEWKIDQDEGLMVRRKVGTRLGEDGRPIIWRDWCLVSPPEAALILRAAVEAERERTLHLIETEAARLEQLCASVTTGKRAGKWAGGAETLRSIATAIRARGEG